MPSRSVTHLELNVFVVLIWVDYYIISRVTDDLTYLHLVLHIYASVNWVSIGFGNDLSPVRSQAIAQTNADQFPIGTLGTNFIDMLI